MSVMANDNPPYAWSKHCGNELLWMQIDMPTASCNRVYAKTKKKKTLEELEILPICSKKRVCEKIVLEEIFEI